MFDVSDEMIVPINAEVPDRPSVFFDPQFQRPAVFGDGPAADDRASSPKSRNTRRSSRASGSRRTARSRRRPSGYIARCVAASSAAS
jgi:hypothetical protein